MFVLVVSPGFSLVQTMMTTDDYTVTNPLVEASLRDGLIIDSGTGDKFCSWYTKVEIQNNTQGEAAELSYGLENK